MAYELYQARDDVIGHGALIIEPKSDRGSELSKERSQSQRRRRRKLKGTQAWLRYTSLDNDYYFSGRAGRGMLLIVQEAMCVSCVGERRTKR